MEKLNLNLPLVDENGKAVMEKTTIAQLLGGTLLQSDTTSETDILKFFTWALELGNKGVIELDESDARKLKNFVVSNKPIFVILKHPILQAIDNLKFK